MTWAIFILSVRNFFGWLYAHPKTVAIAFGLLMFVGVIVYSRACIVQQRIDAKQDEVIQTRIEEANKDAVSKTAGLDVQRTTQTAHEASNERERAIKRDSKEYANTNAGQRFCERFPQDSSCK